jgi:hypothetical protein
MKNCSVLFLLSLVSFLATSQSDYVVTTTGDTLKGKISFQQIGNIEQVVIKGEKRKTLSSIQVRMASLKEEVYKPIQFSGTIQMMKVLTEGYLSLLAFQPPGIMNYDGRLLMLRDGRNLEVPSIGFKKHVSALLSDDPELADQIKDGDMDRKDLDEIIQQYNSFIENKTVAEANQQTLDIKQKSKIESLDEIISEIKQSDLKSDAELFEMLNEVKDKIANEKSIPQYLSNAIHEKLNKLPELATKFGSVIKE